MADFTVTRTIDSFKVGDRVALHPVSNMWMRGMRYGTVCKIGRKYVWLESDFRASPVAVYPRDIAVED